MLGAVSGWVVGYRGRSSLTVSFDDVEKNNIKNVGDVQRNFDNAEYVVYDAEFEKL